MKQVKYLFIALLTVFMTSCEDKYPDLSDGVYAEFVTNKGTAIAALKFKETPLTVGNFVALAEGKHEDVDSTYAGKKYYDGIIFHRVIKDFMIQGGDPTSTGRGGPGYKFQDEIVDSLKHTKKGTLSMANSGPGTNGSQFFITLKETPWLDGRHTIFGEIVKGQDVIDSIGIVETFKDIPKDTIRIETINIIRKGSEAKGFEGYEAFKAEKDRIEKEKEEKLNAEKEKASGKRDELKALRENATKLDSGLGFILTNEGKGATLKSDQQVGVYYAGYFTDGRVFDTNIEALAKEIGQYNEQRAQYKGYDPMPVPYSNQAQMIPGFKEGILKMTKVGDKATFFIPYHLAYGERGAGEVIPPKTDLVFEVEFAKVIEAPKK